MTRLPPCHYPEHSPQIAGACFRPDDEQEACDGLRVTVVSTTVPATLLALRRAAELAYELGARIRILVPHVVPYPLPLDHPPVDPSFKSRHFRTFSMDGAVETSIEVCLCREPHRAVMQAVPSRSIVLVGGRAVWWKTREQRLAKSLNAAGHHVIFVAQN